jgi:hypothetical protein
MTPKSTGNKRKKKRQFAYHENFKILHQSTKSTERKVRAVECEKEFANWMSNKGLVARICK